MLISNMSTKLPRFGGCHLFTHIAETFAIRQLRQCRAEKLIAAGEIVDAIIALVTPSLLSRVGTITRRQLEQQWKQHLERATFEAERETDSDQGLSAVDAILSSCHAWSPSGGGLGALLVNGAERPV